MIKGNFLGELESTIMEIIWQSKEPVSVKFIAETLQKKRSIAYTTVMTIMGRLVTKGLLKRQEKGRAYLYSATYSKDKFLNKISKQIIRNLTSNFGEVAIAHFVAELDKIPSEKKDKWLKILKSSIKD